MSLVAAPALSLIQCLPEPRDRKAHGGDRKCRHSEDVRLQILESGAEVADATPAMAVNMSGTSSQKITRQPVMCVSAPPSSGPMLKPSIRKAVQAPTAAA